MNWRSWKTASWSGWATLLYLSWLDVYSTLQRPNEDEKNEEDRFKSISCRAEPLLVISVLLSSCRECLLMGWWMMGWEFVLRRWRRQSRIWLFVSVLFFSPSSDQPDEHHSFTCSQNIFMNSSVHCVWIFLFQSTANIDAWGGGSCRLTAQVGKLNLAAQLPSNKNRVLNGRFLSTSVVQIGVVSTCRLSWLPQVPRYLNATGPLKSRDQTLFEHCMCLSWTGPIAASAKEKSPIARVAIKAGLASYLPNHPSSDSQEQFQCPYHRLSDLK